MTTTDTTTVDPFGPEQWFGSRSQAALAELYGFVSDLEGDVIEVGSWTGRSTVALANACYPAEMHAVDTWEGSPGEISETLAAERDVYAQFLANVDEFAKGNVRPHRMGWREFFAGSTDPARFVFIDATHTYTEVRDNIEAALALLAPGGIVCGDDMHDPEVARAVLDMLPGALATATLWWWQKPGGSLRGHYERLRRTPSDIFEHLPTFVRLVTERNAQHVIELGTRTGVSTIAWLHGLEKTGGHLTSVDVDARPDIGDWAHWTFVQSDDLDPEWLRRAEPADIVFIDTSHHFEHTLRELHVYRHLVKPGGLMVLHDTELRRPEGCPPGDPPFPVRAAVEEFCAAEGLSWENHPNCFGLGLIEIP